MTLSKKMDIILFLAFFLGLVWLSFRAAFRTQAAMESTVDSLFWEGTLRRRYSETSVRLYGRLLLAGSLCFLALAVAQLAMGSFRWRGGTRAYGFIDLLS